MKKELDELDKKFTDAISRIACSMGSMNEKLGTLERQTKKLFAVQDEKCKPFPNPYSIEGIVEAHIQNIVEHLEATHNISPEQSKRYINHYFYRRYK